MKAILLFSWIILFLASCASSTQFYIPTEKGISVEWIGGQKQSVELKNKSSETIEIQIVEAESKTFIRGFGLAGNSEATVSLESFAALQIKNQGKDDALIKAKFFDAKPDIVNQSERSTINFTLRNSGLKSIPLIIPGVMNPNLSPQSSSGVSLKLGQKIYWKKGMKKIIILTVDDTIQNGDVIDVAKLIREQ